MRLDEFDYYKEEPDEGADKEESFEPVIEPEEEEREEEAQKDGVPDLNEKIAALEAELATVRADFYNYRQRVTREKQEARRRTEEDVITSFLPVLDNLDRALQVPEDGRAKDVLIGVRMVQKQFLSALEELGVTPVSAEGQPFDPAFHEAAGTEPVEDPEQDGKVVSEQLRGYRTKDRVLRPARVTVGRKE